MQVVYTHCAGLDVHKKTVGVFVVMCCTLTSSSARNCPCLYASILYFQASIFKALRRIISWTSSGLIKRPEGTFKAYSILRRHFCRD